jgi:uroporphyrinogen decarboxylase
MSITSRENYLKTLEFNYPEWVPAEIEFAPATWHKYRKDLERLLLRHPLVFEHFREDSIDYDELNPAYHEGEYYRDNWGCLWYNTGEGMEGQVVENPLENWDALDSFQVPDPRIRPDPLRKPDSGEPNWNDIRRSIEMKRKRGEVLMGDGERLFDRLYFLRGFENLMVDIATDDPHLPKLIDMVKEYELKLIQKWTEIDVDLIMFHTDIGTQHGLMISPEKFRRYIKPLFSSVCAACKNEGIHPYVSSDGRLLEIVDDLAECGFSMHDPQVGANTIEGIARAYKGRMCIKLDFDRQKLPFWSIAQIEQHVADVVRQLGSPEGGLILWTWITPDIPLENIEALASAIEHYRCYWS